MKILVTGAKGFIGKNLICEIKNLKCGQVLEYDKNNSIIDLDLYTKDCDFVFHLAGINRPDNQEEFIEGNVNFTKSLLYLLRKNNNKAPIVFSSSTQARLENPYGNSKREAEELFRNHTLEGGGPVVVYRVPNVFGKWCRPFYNSVVATFCYNKAHGLPVMINDPETKLNLVYIDDLTKELLSRLNTQTWQGNYTIIENISPSYSLSLYELNYILDSFVLSRENYYVPDFSNNLTFKLYATFISYLPEGQFAYNLNPFSDFRGSFSEIIKTHNSGQFSINISKPGIIKGNH